MKKERGFTVIELLVAMAILILGTVSIFKSFLVSTKVNVKSYEKDKANIEVTNKIEEIKNNPHKFIENHPYNTETRYYRNLLAGAYYYCLEDKDLAKYKYFDDKSFEEYVKNFFEADPTADGKDKGITDHIEANKNKYDRSLGYYNKEKFNDLLNNPLTDKRTEKLCGIKCIVNKCSFKEYYDSNWGVVTDEASAKYEAKIEVSRKAENNVVQTYNPETVFNEDDRYDVPSVKNYFAVLIKEEDTGRTTDSYTFYIFYNYSSEDLKSDLKKKYGKTIPKKPGDLKDFFTALCHFQQKRPQDDDSPEEIDRFKKQEIQDASYSDFYKVFKRHKDIEGDGTTTCKQLSFEVEKNKTNIPVRIDFDSGSTGPMYNVEVYNMTGKPMELYILHNEANNSEVHVMVNKGESKKTEVYTSKNFAKTVYKIDVKLIRKEDNYTLINYKTEKYGSGEEAQDFNFLDK